MSDENIRKNQGFEPAPADLDRGDTLGLPLPRLQLTWVDDGTEQWACHYELLIPIGKHDIRNEPGRGYQPLPIGKTRMQSVRGPLLDGVLDPPFRDGAHAKWDSERLGFPAFVVYGDVYRRLNAEKPEAASDA